MNHEGLPLIRHQTSSYKNIPQKIFYGACAIAGLGGTVYFGLQVRSAPSTSNEIGLTGMIVLLASSVFSLYSTFAQKNKRNSAEDDRPQITSISAADLEQIDAKVKTIANLLCQSENSYTAITLEITSTNATKDSIIEELEMIEKQIELSKSISKKEEKPLLFSAQNCQGCEDLKLTIAARNQLYNTLAEEQKKLKKDLANFATTLDEKGSKDHAKSIRDLTNKIDEKEEFSDSFSYPSSTTNSANPSPFNSPYIKKPVNTTRPTTTIHQPNFNNNNSDDKETDGL